jgi:hypothetical protein
MQFLHFTYAIDASFREQPEAVKRFKKAGKRRRDYYAF